MNTLKDIMGTLASSKMLLRREYGVTRIGVFGSHVRNEQQDGSDVDILVDFENPVGFFAFLDLEERLERLLGARVDLVTRKALRFHIGERILKETRYV